MNVPHVTLPLDSIVKLPPIAELYRSHGPAVLRRARQILHNEAEAQEVLQDVFTTLVQKPEQFRGASSITTFLYGVTTHTALAKLRNERNRQRLLDDRPPDTNPWVDPTAPQRAELRQLLQSLPLELACVAVHFYLDEMTHDEIAKVMNCSRQWVTKLIGKLKEQQKELV